MKFENICDSSIEQQILGSMLTNVESCLLVKEYNIKANDFYYTYHQELFKAITKVFNSEYKVDLILILHYLKDNDLLQKVKSVTYVTELSTSIASTVNLEHYLKILKTYRQKRESLELAKFINSNLHQDIEDLKQNITKRISNIMNNTQEDTSEQQGMEYLEILERRIRGEEAAIKTGLRELDENISGLYPGDLVSIFAFSGVGKTTLATQIALNNLNIGKKVLFFSLEMAKEQVRGRIISNHSDVLFKHLKTGELSDNELSRVIKSNDFLSINNKLFISEEDSLSNIINKIQLECMKDNVDIVFVDYVGLINTGDRTQKDHERVAECTRVFKKIAKDFKKPIVILAQGKQESASKMSNRNMMVDEKVSVNDIAGGASIYRDSDIVLGLYRNTSLDNKVVREMLRKEDENNINYNSRMADKNPYCVNILIKKNRAGERNIISCRWNPEYYRIRNW